MVATLVYVFSMSSICMGQMLLFQPIFIWLPLILSGIEKIFSAKRSNMLYIVSLAALFLSSTAQSWWCVIIVIIYCIVYCVKNKFKLRECALYFIRFLVNSLIAFLISAPINLPLIYGMLNNSGIADISYYVPILYDYGYYISLLPSLFL